MPTELPQNNPGPQRPGWAIPAVVFAVVLLAGAIIFASAGPDRTRTSEFNAPASTKSDRLMSQKRELESGIPPSNKDDPATTPVPTLVPQKSNPAGTQ
jgi:hypothetical protein